MSSWISLRRSSWEHVSDLSGVLRFTVFTVALAAVELEDAHPDLISSTPRMDKIQLRIPPTLQPCNLRFDHIEHTARVIHSFEKSTSNGRGHEARAARHEGQARKVLKGISLTSSPRNHQRSPKGALRFKEPSKHVSTSPRKAQRLGSSICRTQGFEDVDHAHRIRVWC